MVEYREWICNEPGEECFKRLYETSEFKPKVERLLSYYKYQVNKPKIYIKEVMKPVRNYYYYMGKKKLHHSHKARGIISENSASDSAVKEFLISQAASQVIKIFWSTPTIF
jgi:hypothetical protein